jgi:hypothetical protein
MSLSWEFSYRMANSFTQHPFSRGNIDNQRPGALTHRECVAIHCWGLMFFVMKWVWVCSKTHSLKYGIESRVFHLEQSIPIHDIHLRGGTEIITVMLRGVTHRKMCFDSILRAHVFCRRVYNIDTTATSRHITFSHLFFEFQLVVCTAAADWESEAYKSKDDKVFRFCYRNYRNIRIFKNYRWIIASFC